MNQKCCQRVLNFTETRFAYNKIVRRRCLTHEPSTGPWCLADRFPAELGQRLQLIAPFQLLFNLLSPTLHISLSTTREEPASNSAIRRAWRLGTVLRAVCLAREAFPGRYFRKKTGVSDRPPRW